MSRRCPHGASASYSEVEYKGMQPNAMNFSERTTSIYILVLLAACCGGAICPGMSTKSKTVNGNPTSHCAVEPEDLHGGGVRVSFDGVFGACGGDHG